MTSPLLKSRCFKLTSVNSSARKLKQFSKANLSELPEPTETSNFYCGPATASTLFKQKLPLCGHHKEDMDATLLNDITKYK